MRKEKALIFWGTLAGRISGYIREVLILLLYGLSELADDLILTITSFDSLSSIFSYGTISMITTGVMTSTPQRNKSLLFFLQISGLVFATITGFFIFLSSKNMFNSIMPFVALLNIAYSIELSIQQIKGSYLWTSFTAVIANIILVTCILIFPNRIGFLTILIAGLFIRNLLIVAYNNRRYNIPNSNNNISVSLKKKIILTIVASGIFYLLPVIDRFIVSDYKELSTFNFGDRIIIFGTIILNSVFVYPLLIKLQTKENKKFKFNEIFKKYSKEVIALFILSLLPLMFRSFLLKISSDYHDLIEFSIFHLPHAIPYLILLSYIQYLTINSSYKRILVLSSILIFTHYIIGLFTINIIHFTVVVTIIEILIISIIFLRKHG